MSTTVRPTAQVEIFVEVLGEDLAIEFLMKFGGAMLSLSQKPRESSELVQLVRLGSAMKFKRHKAVDYPYHAAKHMRGEITPTLLVLHDTASRITPLNAAGYLQNNDVKVSVHFVLERDGYLQQQVPLNRGANHAGKSEYNGKRGCNNFSIGVEIVNPGRLSYAGPGKSRAWFGKVYDNAEYGIVEMETPEHGKHWWMP